MSCQTQKEVVQLGGERAAPESSSVASNGSTNGSSNGAHPNGNYSRSLGSFDESAERPEKGTLDHLLERSAQARSFYGPFRSTPCIRTCQNVHLNVTLPPAGKELGSTEVFGCDCGV